MTDTEKIFPEDTPLQSTTAERTPDTSKRAEHRIVAIGASACGFEALEALLRAYRGTGLSLVFIQHIGANQGTMLSELMRRVTSIPIVDAQEGDEFEPNTLYVLPAGHYNILNDRLIRVDGDHSSTNSINVFFRS